MEPVSGELDALWLLLSGGFVMSSSSRAWD
jgi:hypothetical protein